MGGKEGPLVYILCVVNFRLSIVGTEHLGVCWSLKLSGTIVPSRLIRVRGIPARLRRVAAGHRRWERRRVRGVV